MKKELKEMIGSSLFLIAILLIISLIVLVPVLNMLLLGAVIAYGIRPISSKIQSKIKFSSISTIISIILIVLPLILIFTYVIYIMMDFSYTFISNNNISPDFNQSVNVVNSYLPSGIESSASAINQIIFDAMKMVFSYLVGFVKSLPIVMLKLFVLIFSTFYFVRDGHKIKEHLFYLIPKERHEFFTHMIIEIKTVLKSIFYGHFLTGVIIGIIGTIGFYLLGYEYALFLGILTGICQLIPIVGPWPVYTVLFVSDLLSGNYVRAAIVLFFGFGLSLSDMYIRPALTSKYVDIHPMILILGFLSGPLVFGLVGFILGPLILGITYAVVKTYKKEKEMLKKKNSKKT
jgi:predicted PurR-regulated permease PerM